MSSVVINEIGHVFEIRLNRADVRNAFDAETIELITQAFAKAGKSGARVVYLKGEGKSFCAGADLAWMKSMKEFSLEENKADSEKLFDMFETARNCSLPVVCRAQGHVMGGATGLLSVSDIVVAEENTKFAFSEVRLGLAPAVISPFVMRKMDSAPARELMLTGRVFTAIEAKESGLVNYVATEADLDDVVKTQLDQFLALGPQAVRETKRLLNTVYTPMFNGLKDATTQVIAGLRIGDEGQEGLAAFFEKRNPSWKQES